MVHRDLKPENILLVDEVDIKAGLKLIDFGIAGRQQFDHQEHKGGTLKYCPPELLSGLSYKAD